MGTPLALIIKYWKIEYWHISKSELCYLYPVLFLCSHFPLTDYNSHPWANTQQPVTVCDVLQSLFIHHSYFSKVKRRPDVVTAPQFDSFLRGRHVTKSLCHCANWYCLLEVFLLVCRVNKHHHQSFEPHPTGRLS